MKTLTIIKCKYMGMDVLIPIIEEEVDNFDFTNFVIQEIDENGGLQLIRQPLWQYLENDQDLTDFLNSFFQETENRSVKKIDCLIKDHTNPKTLETQYGIITLPSESQFSLYCVVKESENQFISPKDAELPVLIFNKN